MSTAVLKNSFLIERLRLSLERSDLEAAFDEIRLYKKEGEEEARRASAEGCLPLPALFEMISELAEECLGGATFLSQEALAKMGQAPRGPFAIVAMGKFGGRELTFGSDLDIIYFFEDPEDQEVSARLGQRIISTLSVPTRYGVAYRIDTALRPSGNAGTLVSSLASFEDYHKTLGRTWERQALIKARPVIGPETFREKIAERIEAIAYRKSDRSIALEMDHLRRRMEMELARETKDQINLKVGRGGIVDIEFAVQYLQLLHGRDRPSLRAPNTLVALKALADEKILAPEDSRQLSEAYLFYREVETEMRRVLEQSTDRLERGSPYWETCLKHREETRRLYRKILNL